MVWVVRIDFPDGRLVVRVGVADRLGVRGRSHADRVQHPGDREVRERDSPLCSVYRGRCDRGLSNQPTQASESGVSLHPQRRQLDQSVVTIAEEGRAHHRRITKRPEGGEGSSERSSMNPCTADDRAVLVAHDDVGDGDSGTRAQRECGFADPEVSV